MKRSVKIKNGKGFLHVDQSIQIPTDFAINQSFCTYIGYYVGSSFRVVRVINPFLPSDISHELLKLQVSYDVPLFAVNLLVSVSLFNVI